MDLSQARPLYTKILIDVYQERIRPKGFLRSFFPSTFRKAKQVSIEVERTYEKTASDVVRGSEGNFNRFSNSTEKVWTPPFWREYFNATELDLYDQVIGAQGNANTNLFTALMDDVASRIGALQDMIERSKEILCAQVLQTGTITINNGENISFFRKDESIVNLSASGEGGYFDTNSEVFDQIAKGCTFLRTKGKVTSFEFVAIFGLGAWEAFLKNTKVLARQNLFNLVLDQIAPPQLKAAGGVFHGTITCGSYRVQCWTYPEYYDNAAGESTPYIDDANVVLTIPQPRFKFAHALVPQVIMPGDTFAPQSGEWVYGDFIDGRKAKHDFDVQCAGMPVPVAVDQMYTMQAIEPA
jgi:hypothetical protein